MPAGLAFFQSLLRERKRRPLPPVTGQFERFGIIKPSIKTSPGLDLKMAGPAPDFSKAISHIGSSRKKLLKNKKPLGLQRQRLKCLISDF